MKINIAYFESNSSKILFYILLLLLGVLTAERIAIAFSYHNSLEGFDNNFVYPVIRLLKGNGIYPDAENYPFVVNPYAPLLFYISFIVSKLAGVNGDEAIQVYFVTRSLCLLFDLATMAILYRLLFKKFQTGRLTALGISISYLFLISQWGFTFNRSDSLVLLTFAGFLWLLITYVEKKSTASLLLLACICSISILSKQTGIITPVIAAAVLLWFKEWKHFLLFSLLFLVMLAMFLLTIITIRPDEHLFQHLVKAVSNRVDGKWFYSNVFKVLIYNYAAVPLLAAIFIAIRQMTKPSAEKIFSVISIALLLTTFFTLGIATKWGSHVGYFHEVLFLSACIIGLSLRSSFSLPLKTLQTITLGYSFVILVLFSEILLKNFLFYLNNSQTDKLKYQEQKEIAGFIKSRILVNEEYVYAPTDHTVDFFKNMLEPEIAAPNLDIVTCCTLPDGNFNYSLLREGFKTGKIKFIISKKAVPLENHFNVDLGAYQVVKQFENFEIYQFRHPE